MVSRKQPKNDKKEQQDLDSPGFAVMLNNFTLYSIYRKLIALSIMATLLLFFNIGGLFFFTNEEIEPRYTSMNEGGSIYKSAPLTEPYVSESELLKDAQELTGILYTYDYINYPKQIPKAEQYFSPRGWKSYQDALSQSKNMELVKSEKAIVSVSIEGTPNVARKRLNPQGYYEWEVIVPAKIIYNLTTHSTGKVRTQEGELEFRYIRATLSQTPKQFAVSNVQFRPKKR